MSLGTFSMLFIVVFFICSVHTSSAKTMIFFAKNQVIAFIWVPFWAMRSCLAFFVVFRKIIMYPVVFFFSHQFKMFRINAQFNFTYMMNMMVWWYFTLKQFITKPMGHYGPKSWPCWNRCRTISSTTSGTLPNPTSIIIYFVTRIKTFYSRLSFFRHSINNIITNGV